MKAVRKGKEYERHIKKYLKSCGLSIAQVPRSGAGDIKGDLWLYLPDGCRIVIECKKQEKINIWECIAQAKLEAKHFPFAVVFSRNQEGDDYICMSVKDFVDIAYYELKGD